jgi:hypothetical protein
LQPGAFESKGEPDSPRYQLMEDNSPSVIHAAPIACPSSPGEKYKQLRIDVNQDNDSIVQSADVGSAGQKERDLSAHMFEQTNEDSPRAIRIY